MNLLKRIKHKLYFKYANWALKTQAVELPASMHQKKNVFIYFDYEREFSGFETNIADKDIINLLNVLNENQFKTTWFTVGKIFETYPGSIRAILDNGHEIASHSFNHIIPQLARRKELEKDFQLFSAQSEKFSSVRGFHSPQGKWSLRMFDSLYKQSYSYDLAGVSSKNNGQPFYVYNKGCKILRILTVGDDWPLYLGDFSEQEVYEYFLQLYDKIQVGHLSGIGFHPWILHVKPNIFKGFQRFLKFLNLQQDITKLRVIDYANEVLKINK